MFYIVLIGQLPKNVSAAFEEQGFIAKTTPPEESVGNYYTLYSVKSKDFKTSSIVQSINEADLLIVCTNQEHMVALSYYTGHSCSIGVPTVLYTEDSDETMIDREVLGVCRDRKTLDGIVECCSQLSRYKSETNWFMMHYPKLLARIRELCLRR